MLASKGLMASSTVTPLYVNDVFSTWLYTGNSTSQTITNDIDLAGKGGMVWVKSRSAATNNQVWDSARGLGSGGAFWRVSTNNNEGEFSTSGGLLSLNSTGFSLTNAFDWNSSAQTYASWTFRDAPKFFDVVTYTGTGANRTIAHNLGSVPGMIIVKRRTSGVASDWQIYHRSLANTQYMVLNSSAAVATGATRWNSTTPTSSVFSLGTDTTVNLSSATYVAYLFAHDAGGFGQSGTDNAVSCGIYTGNGAVAGPTITLGYEPQWLMIKNATGTGSWQIIDSMRGMPVGAADASLLANTAGAESSASDFVSPTSTGFQVVTSSAEVNTNTATYIYVAIRRPNKPPTIGTQVLSVKTYAATTTSASVTHDIVFDLEFNKNRVTTDPYLWVDRLRGLTGRSLSSTSTGIQANWPTYWSPRNQKEMFAPSTFDGFWAATTGTQSHSSIALARAPTFFDIVCYTGTGVATTVAHNLTVVPELMIVKGRSSASNWPVYAASRGPTQGSYLNATSNFSSFGAWNSTNPTSTVFSVGTLAESNGSGATYVAYLFATVPGVSKVGSYTGTGTTLQINCGFTAGARFVMIKRADSTGSWYVWDTAKGIIAGNDPYLLFNSTAVEVTSTDYIDPLASGFEISSTAPIEINASGGSYIFLAIA